MGRKKTVTEGDAILPIIMKISFKQAFKEFCDKNGFSMSKRIKILMQKDMEENYNGK